MSNIIPINYSNERQTVLGRDLHQFLEVETPYHIWFPRMCDYGFSENIDFCTNLFESTGGRPSTDHQITIEMAKEISMIQRTEKGKQARQYFIELEKQWNSPEAVMARALKMADIKITSLQSNIEVLKSENKLLAPKAESFDNFISAENLQNINSAAKCLGWGRNKLFDELRRRKILMKNNQPYQEYIDRGYFETKESPIKGLNINKIQTFATPKGIAWLSKLLKSS